MRPIIHHRIKFFLIAICAVPLVAHFGPEAAIVGLHIAGRNKCRLSEAANALVNGSRLSECDRKMQRGSRFVRRDGRFELWDTPLGRFWRVGHVTNGFARVLAESYLGIYDDGTHGIRQGNVVLDCGADYGTVTRAALNRGAKLVVAIEPSPAKVECLRRTFDREISDGRVIVIPKGVWDHEDTLPLHDDTLVLNRSGSPQLVPLTTIDHVVSSLGLVHVDFINMDIEGAEKNALLGARATLLRFRPRLGIAAEHFSDDSERIPKLVRSISPDYKTVCTWCGLDRTWYVRPLVLQMFATDSAY